ncbi:holin family protein [Faecalispora jeddahensis]|uniref:phage holin family protein n=1 Tax=Faecalispora jeddahensis TaxID=1414721 RepID=UPI001898A938|nr:phage holin family protein [Faecalispora jeddahensis]
MALSAKSMYISVLTVLSAAGAAILSALGGWDTSLQFLIGIMAVDYLLGILIALVWHKSQKSADGESSASLKSLLRKFSVLLIVYVAVQLDTVANTGGYLRTAVILFFIANEGFSVIENLGIMGVPMPPAVKNAFAAIKSKSETAE